MNWQLFLFIYVLNSNFSSVSVHFINKCERAIYEGCPDSYLPTPDEVERARIYIQDKFMKESSLPPTLPPCPKLYVRRNFKCMSHEERLRVIRVLQQLYENGFMWELAEIHNECYVPWHKSSEGATGHRWLNTKLELAMRQIDPDISIPYWIPSEECMSPHKSLIWKYFGTSGNESNDWCVANCPFREQTKGLCIKRQWNPDGKISPWYCPMIENIGIGLGNNINLMLFATIGQHFHYHLNIGGANGHFSSKWASYDFIFYMLHVYYTDDLMVRWQLSHPSHLTPLTYNWRMWKFDPSTRKTSRANISIDTLCHYNTPVLDTWQIGFGEQCWVSDTVVQAINQELNNESTGAVEKFKQSLPITLRSILSPIISNWKPLLTKGLESPDYSICNEQCRGQPQVPGYNTDETGRQALKIFREEWGFDMARSLLISDLLFRTQIELHNGFGYCSPYVPSVNPKNESVIKTHLIQQEDLEFISYKKFIKAISNFVLGDSYQ